MENIQTISKNELQSYLAHLPSVKVDGVSPEQIATRPVLVILDDDPNGTQTCHDINVLTVWDRDILVDEFNSQFTGFFILTNSRALPPTEARKLIRTICTSVKEAADIAKRKFEVVLRGDSTLRGHFPDEPEAAEEVFGEAVLWVSRPLGFGTVLRAGWQINHERRALCGKSRWWTYSCCADTIR